MTTTTGTPRPGITTWHASIRTSLSVPVSPENAKDVQLLEIIVGTALERLQRERAVYVDRLNAGESWLKSHPGHPKHDEAETKWINLLREYELTEDLITEVLAKDVDRGDA